jgi:hypothetical protein
MKRFTLKQAFRYAHGYDGGASNAGSSGNSGGAVPWTDIHYTTGGAKHETAPGWTARREMIVSLEQ